MENSSTYFVILYSHVSYQNISSLQLFKLITSVSQTRYPKLVQIVRKGASGQIREIYGLFFFITINVQDRSLYAS